MPLVVEDRDRLVEVAGAVQTDHARDGLASHGLDELTDPTLVLEGLGSAPRPLVVQCHRESGHQEAGLHEPLADQGRVIARVLGEDLRVGPPAHACSRARARDTADHAQAGLALEGGVGSIALEDSGHSSAEGDRVRLATAVDLDIKPG